MKMVEMERKRSDEEHAILLKRIAFLTEELEETKRQLRAKVTRPAVSHLPSPLSPRGPFRPGTARCMRPMPPSPAGVRARGMWPAVNGAWSRGCMPSSMV